MKLSRIDQIALNGGDGLHYKYEAVAEDIFNCITYRFSLEYGHDWFIEDVVKILVENFPNDET